MLVLCLSLCYGHAIPRDALAKLNNFGLWHARIKIDGEETLEARFLGRDSVVFYVWYYCCAYVAYVAYVVHVASVMLCSCGIVYL